MEFVRKRKGVEAVTEYEICVGEQPKYSSPGTENYVIKKDAILFLHQK